MKSLFLFLFIFLAFGLWGQPLQKGGLIELDITESTLASGTVEGLAICKISWTPDGTTPTIKVVYSSEPAIQEATQSLLPMLLEAHHPEITEKNTRWLPLVFQPTPRSKRKTTDLLEDAFACLKFGLLQTSLNFFNQAEAAHRPRKESFYLGYEGRKQVYFRLKRWQEARIDINNQLSSSDLQVAEQGRLRMQRASLALLTGDGRQAIGDLMWLEKNPNARTPIDGLEILQLSKADAIGLAKTAGELSHNLPGGPNFWLNFLHAQALAEAHMYPDAYLMYQEAGRKAPNVHLKAGILSLIGKTYYREGKLLQALSTLRQAQDLYPNQAIPEYYTGMTLVQMNYPHEASEAFEKALGLGLRGEEAAHAKKLNEVLTFLDQ